MCEVPSGTDNAINYSVNNQGRNSTGNIANYSANNQGIGGTGNHNNNANMSIIDRRLNNEVLQTYHSTNIRMHTQYRDHADLQENIKNSRSLEAAYQEQLNQPNLPQEEISRLRGLRNTAIIQSATYAECVNSKQRQYTQSRELVQALQPTYNEIMRQY